MKKLRFPLLLLLAASLAACGTLDPAGAYKGDKTLYSADVTLTTSYDTIHAFVTWEYANRPTLVAITPAIRLSADAIRAQAPMAFARALAVRDAYASSSTAQNASALGTALSVLQSLVSQAQGILAQATTAPPPVPAPTPSTITTVKAAVAGAAAFSTK